MPVGDDGGPLRPRQAKRLGDGVAEALHRRQTTPLHRGDHVKQVA